MAITKKPSPKKSVGKEAQAQKFINPNGDGSTTPKRDLKDVIIGFDKPLLERIDRMAQFMGQSRTAFVVNAAAEKLLALERQGALQS